MKVKEIDKVKSYKKINILINIVSLKKNKKKKTSQYTRN